MSMGIDMDMGMDVNYHMKGFASTKQTNYNYKPPNPSPKGFQP